MTLEPLTSGDSQNDVRPATPDAGVQPERPAGRRPPPAAPVIALRMEGLLTWTAERMAKFPRDHKFTVGDRLLETCLDVMSGLTDAAYRRDKQEWPPWRCHQRPVSCSHNWHPHASRRRRVARREGGLRHSGPPHSRGSTYSPIQGRSSMSATTRRAKALARMGLA